MFNLTIDSKLPADIEHLQRSNSSHVARGFPPTLSRAALLIRSQLSYSSNGTIQRFLFI